MITVTASQKIFTNAKVMYPTGICAEHLRNLAKRHRLSFFVAPRPLNPNRSLVRWPLSEGDTTGPNLDYWALWAGYKF